MTGYEIEHLRTARHREWRVKLTDAGTVPDRLIPSEEFVPDLASLYVSAPHDAAPFSQLRVKLIGPGDGRRPSAMDYDNSSPNPEHSIRRAPRDLAYPVAEPMPAEFWMDHDLITEIEREQKAIDGMDRETIAAVLDGLAKVLARGRGEAGTQNTVERN